jgi:streptogramin lyase
MPEQTGVAETGTVIDVEECWSVAAGASVVGQFEFSDATATDWMLPRHNEEMCTIDQTWFSEPAII